MVCGVGKKEGAHVDGDVVTNLGTVLAFHHAAKWFVTVYLWYVNSCRKAPLESDNYDLLLLQGVSYFICLGNKVNILVIYIGENRVSVFKKKSIGAFIFTTHKFVCLIITRIDNYLIFIKLQYCFWTLRNHGHI